MIPSAKAPTHLRIGTPRDDGSHVDVYPDNSFNVLDTPDDPGGQDPPGIRFRGNDGEVGP
jgi:hypothetical protein